MSQKIAVVTGGNKGIGFAIVKALCKELQNGIVYLTSRNEERGKAAVEELKKEGLNPHFHQLDIDSSESIDRFRNFLKTTHGGLDILVNNAAISYNFKKNDTTPFSVQAKISIATNYTGTLNVCHALFALIRSHGRVCHLTSMLGALMYKKLSPKLQQAFKQANTEEDVNKLMADFVTSAERGTIKEDGWVAGYCTPNGEFISSSEKGTLEEGYAGAAYCTSKAGIITVTRIQATAISADTSRQDILINCCCPGYVDTDMTSHKGTKTPDEGAITPVYCSLLPSAGPNGKHLSNKSVVETW